jgi:hypothetical protein
VTVQYTTSSTVDIFAKVTAVLSETVSVGSAASLSQIVHAVEEALLASGISRYNLPASAHIQSLVTTLYKEFYGQVLYNIYLF